MSEDKYDEAFYEKMKAFFREDELCNTMNQYDLIEIAEHCVSFSDFVYEVLQIALDTFHSVTEDKERIELLISKIKDILYEERQTR